jgi:hypothetical protein
MRLPKLRLAALALTSGLVLGGCAYGLGNPYGSHGGVSVGYGGYGSPYGGYGYGSQYGGYGYGSPYGGYGYGSPYGGYGYGYGGYPYGWNDGWYYPGSGYYVYDRDRRRRQITDAERQYWREKFNRIRSGTTTTSGTKVTTSSIAPRENWSGFRRDRTRSTDRTSSSSSRSAERSRSTRSADTSSSSRSEKSRSSDFMRRHSPSRSKD